MQRSQILEMEKTAKKTAKKTQKTTEKKKTTKYPITLDKRIGFICEECYNANIWATKEDNRKQVSLFKDQLHLKLFNT